jgi:peptidase E
MGIIVGLGGGDCNTDAAIIFDKIISLSGKKNPGVIILPTAKMDDKDGNADERAYFASKGCETQFMLVTKENLTPEEIDCRLNGADIIFVGGGNLKYLMNAWRETGTDKALKNAYKNGKVLCGSSSGMMCWFAEGFDDCGENGEFMFVKALGFIPYCACPHFESGSWSSFETRAEESSLSCFALENGAALISAHGEMSVISGSEGGRVYLFDKNNGYRKEVFGGTIKSNHEI